MSEIPYGYCHCGCGGKTNIIPKSVFARNQIKGEPRRFIAGHHRGLPEEIRFWSKVAKKGDDDCWNWTGGKTRGYGAFNPNGKRVIAHRAAWFYIHGEIASGFLVCHKCDNPSCCNPNHLFLGTQLDNMTDMTSKGRGNIGERHGNSKLTDIQAGEIKQLKPRPHVKGNGDLAKSLAKKYGMRVDNIYFIWRGDTWKHVQ